MGQGVGLALVSSVPRTAAARVTKLQETPVVALTAARSNASAAPHTRIAYTTQSPPRWPAVILPAKTVQDDDPTTKQVVFLVDNTAALVKTGAILPFTGDNLARLLSPSSLQDKVRPGRGGGAAARRRQEMERGRAGAGCLCLSPCSKPTN